MLKKISFSLIFATLLIFLSVQCCSTKSDKNDSNQNLTADNFAALPLPQGTADITGTLLNLIIKEEDVSGIFIIDAVNGYGPATPPIGTGSLLTLKFHKSLLKPGIKTVRESFQQDKKYKLRIRSLYENYKREKTWQIIKVN